MLTDEPTSAVSSVALGKPSASASGGLSTPSASGGSNSAIDNSARPAKRRRTKKKGLNSMITTPRSSSPTDTSSHFNTDIHHILNAMQDASETANAPLREATPQEERDIFAKTANIKQVRTESFVFGDYNQQAPEEHPRLKRLKRKHKLREWKRQHNEKLFDLEKTVKSWADSSRNTSNHVYNKSSLNLKRKKGLTINTQLPGTIPASLIKTPSSAGPASPFLPPHPTIVNGKVKLDKLPTGSALPQYYSQPSSGYYPYYSQPYLSPNAFPQRPLLSYPQGYYPTAGYPYFQAPTATAASSTTASSSSSSQSDSTPSTTPNSAIPRNPYYYPNPRASPAGTYLAFNPQTQSYAYYAVPNPNAKYMPQYPGFGQGPKKGLAQTGAYRPLPPGMAQGALAMQGKVGAMFAAPQFKPRMMPTAKGGIPMVGNIPVAGFQNNGAQGRKVAIPKAQAVIQKNPLIPPGAQADIKKEPRVKQEKGSEKTVKTENDDSPGAKCDISIKKEGASSPPHEEDEALFSNFERSKLIMIDTTSSFRSTIYGRDEKETTRMVQNHFAGREVKPLLWRDNETKPPHKLLIEEMLNFIYGEDASYFQTGSIDFSYLHPFHLRQVNQMLNSYFFPGIDICEWLKQPELSIVVMYKKLVIGCGFITPEGYIPYLFLLPQWMDSAIVSFMLYHLVQSCPSKEICIHTCVNSPFLSVIIPHLKCFGFEPEAYHLNFYDKFCNLLGVTSGAGASSSPLSNGNHTNSSATSSTPSINFFTHLKQDSITHRKSIVAFAKHPSGTDTSTAPDLHCHALQLRLKLK